MADQGKKKHAFAGKLGHRYGFESDQLTVIVTRTGDNEWRMKVKGDVELVFSQPPAFTIQDMPVAFIQ